MKKISKTNWSLENIEIITPILKSGGIGVLPTDTLYGIVGSALFPEAVERIYKLRKRNKKKPLIILIGSLGDLQLFSIELDLQTKEILNQLWPAKVSVVLPCSQEKLEYLHRTNKTLAFRVPDDEGLRTLLEKTGPLVAPSANFEGEKPAQTIAEAKKYFGEKIDFYIDFGKRTSKPSTLVEIENGKVSVIREGAVKIASQALAF